MKRLFLNLAIFASIFAVTSCEDDGGDLTINQDNDTIYEGGGGGTTPTPDTTLNGFVLDGETLTLDPAIEYSLNGPLEVRSGGTLVIPAGTKIVAQNGSDIYIAILQGGTIRAEGTPNNPITLTAATPEPGAWGGLVVLGNAPINAGTSATSEIGAFNYGGDDAEDSSGTIEYVVIEYSGGAVDTASENNGFSFYGVGSGTTVNHIQSYYGSDDGVEFFGGTVNASNIVLIGNEDDSLDWTEGWSGTVTDVYIRQEGEFYDKAIEADGFNPDIGINVEPAFYSNPTLVNVTIIGFGSGHTTQNGAEVSAGSYEAVRLREATQGNFTNLWIEGFGEAFDIDSNDEGATVNLNCGNHVVNDELNATAVFADVTRQVKNDTGVEFAESDFLTVDASATGTDVNAWAASWAVGL